MTNNSTRLDSPLLVTTRALQESLYRGKLLMVPVQTHNFRISRTKALRLWVSAMSLVLWSDHWCAAVCRVTERNNTRAHFGRQYHKSRLKPHSPSPHHSVYHSDIYILLVAIRLPKTPPCLIRYETEYLPGPTELKDYMC